MKTANAEHEHPLPQALFMAGAGKSRLMKSMTDLILFSVSMLNGLERSKSISRYN